MSEFVSMERGFSTLGRMRGAKSENVQDVPFEEVNDEKK